MKFKNYKKHGRALKFVDGFGDTMLVTSPFDDGSHIYIGPQKTSISMPKEDARKFAKAILKELGE